MTIRTATIDDARAIAEAHVDAWRSAYRDILPDATLAALSVDDRASMWQRVAGAGTSIVLVVQSDAGIEGFASAGPARGNDLDHERVGEIAAIYLRERSWSRGDGRRMFERASGLLRKRGFVEMIVWVLEANERGRRFYERMGMTLEEDAETFFESDGRRFREVRYRMPLDR